MTDLASAYRDSRNFREERDLLERALPIMEAHYGPEHLAIAEMLTKLANAYGALGDNGMQQELHNRAVQMKMRSPSHARAHDLASS